MNLTASKHSRVVVARRFARLFARLGIAAMLCITAAFATGTRPVDPAPAHITVLTWNLFDGVGNLTGMIDIENVVHSTHFNFRARAPIVAQIIDDHRPHIIALQEVANWSGLVDLDPINENFLGLLQQQLLDRGLRYDVVGSLQTTEFSGSIHNDPPFASFLHWRERIVILARHSSHLDVLKVQTGQYNDILTLPGTSDNLQFQRGWIAADIAFRGLTARYVCTQLEPRSGSVRRNQAAQLIDSLSGDAGPVIIMGDFGAGPNSTLCQQFIDAGYAGLGDFDLLDGPTCCQAPDLLNSASALDVRTDHVLLRGTLSPVSAERVGHRQSDRTPGGLWPSDHAGVLAKITLE
jgi:endonuclease/exonuclease/phosphatase family metal-dependent hydrolase